MNPSSHVQKPSSLLSKRRVGLAAIAAILACAACCALPLLAAAGFGSGLLAALTGVFGAGVELFVAATVFAVVLGALALRSSLKRRAGTACGASCKADGTCCARGSATRA